MARHDFPSTSMQGQTLFAVEQSTLQARRPRPVGRFLYEEGRALPSLPVPRSCAAHATGKPEHRCRWAWESAVRP
eukprot:7120578-Heterocapsa_arctica.AAC.1